MATVTRQAIREYMIDLYQLGRRGTATTGGITSITDDVRFGGHSGAMGMSIGDAVMITGGSGAPAEEFSRISNLPLVTTGVITLDPALTAAVANTDTFETLFRPLNFESRQHNIHDAIDRALNVDLFEKLDVPFTLVTDGDMLKTGDPDSVSGGGSWDIGSLGALVKRAVDFPHASRALRTTNNATNEFAASVSISVIPAESYYFEVACRATAATMTARLDLRDVSNSADIDLENDNSTDQAPVILRNTVTMPAGCEVVQVRLGGDESNAAIDWYYVILHKTDAREFTVADRAELTSDTGSPTGEARIEADRLGRIFYYTTHNWGTRGKSKKFIGHEPVMGQAGLWQYETDGRMGGQSLWYEEFYKPGPLGSDTAITGLPVHHVAAVATEILLRPLRRDDRWADLYTQALLDKQTFIHLYDDQKVIANKAPRSVSLARV